ncbi:hypothetical protein JCM5350_003543 [Sporobolomyces pararoseus]
MTTVAATETTTGGKREASTELELSLASLSLDPTSPPTTPAAPARRRSVHLIDVFHDSFLDVLGGVNRPRTLEQFRDEVAAEVEKRMSTSPEVSTGNRPVGNGICTVHFEKALSRFFGGSTQILVDYISNSRVSILMIGEEPTLSSAITVAGLRGSFDNLLATGIQPCYDPTTEVLETHLGRTPKLTREFKFDYNVVYGHCLYPENKRYETPFDLLYRTLDTVQTDIRRRRPNQSVLVIFTIPHTDRYWEEFNMGKLVNLHREDYIYLGANRTIEEEILKFGYLHARVMKPWYNGHPNSLHHQLKEVLFAHVFLLRKEKEIY